MANFAQLENLMFFACFFSFEYPHCNHGSSSQSNPSIIFKEEDLIVLFIYSLGAKVLMLSRA